MGMALVIKHIVCYCRRRVFCIHYHIVQKFESGNFDDFDEWLATHQSFSLLAFSHLMFLLWSLQSIRQSFTLCKLLQGHEKVCNENETETKKQEKTMFA